MKTLMYLTGTLAFAVSICSSPLKSDVYKWLHIPVPSDTESVQASPPSEEYARTRLPSKPTQPEVKAPPQTEAVAVKADVKVNTPKQESLKSNKAESPKQQPTQPPTLQEIKDAVRDASAEAILPLLKPIVTQVNKLTEKATALEQAIAKLEATGIAAQSDAARTASALRAELDVVRGSVQELTAVVEVLKTNANLERTTKREKDPDVEKLKTTVDKLATTVDSLARKVETLSKKPEPPAAKSPEPQPEPKPGAWNTKKNTRLPCGYIWQGLTVTPEGVYVLCPKCGQLSFHK